MRGATGLQCPTRSFDRNSSERDFPRGTRTYCRLTAWWAWLGINDRVGSWSGSVHPDCRVTETPRHRAELRRRRAEGGFSTTLDSAEPKDAESRRKATGMWAVRAEVEYSPRLLF